MLVLIDSREQKPTIRTLLVVLLVRAIVVQLLVLVIGVGTLDRQLLLLLIQMRSAYRVQVLGNHHFAVGTLAALVRCLVEGIRVRVVAWARQGGDSDEALAELVGGLGLDCLVFVLDAGIRVDVELLALHGLLDLVVVEARVAYLYDLVEIGEGLMLVHLSHS